MDPSIEAHIQQLARAGLATHVIATPDAIDPLFAVSRMHDYTEVVFSAAFQDGVVVLGCPEVLPDPLKAMAEPIVIKDVPQSTEPALQLSSPDAQSDEATAKGNEKDSERLIAMFETLDTKVTQLMALEGMIAEGHDKLDQSIRESAGAGDVAGELHRMTEQLATLPSLDAIQTGQSAFLAQLPDSTEFTQALATLEQKITGASDSDALGDISQTIQRIEACLSSPDRPDKATEELQRLIVAVEAQSTPDQSALAELTEEISAFKNSLTGSVADKVAELQSGVHNLQDTLVALAKAGRSDVTTRLDVQLQDIQVIKAALSSSTEASRPNEFDLGVERILTELKAQNQPDLGLLDRFSEDNATLKSGLAELLADVRRLEDSLSKNQNADPPEIQAQLEALQAGQAQIVQGLPDPLQIDALSQQISAVAQRPDPVLDLTAQRQLFAHFAHASGAVIKRLEATVADLGSHEKETDQIEQVLVRLDDLAADAALHDLKAGFAALQSDISGLRLAHAETSDRFEATIAKALDRPTPVLDLTAQRQGFASFSTVMATVVKRLEDVASRFDGALDPDIPSSDSFEDDFVDAVSTVDRDIEEESPTDDTPEIDHSPELEDAPEQESNAVTFHNDTISADALMLSFAELVAKQIRDNRLAGDTVNGAQSR